MESSGEARSKSAGKGELSEDGSVGRWPRMKVGTELKGNRLEKARLVLSHGSGHC